jgi:2-keto-4-pentenoate hydratase
LRGAAALLADARREVAVLRELPEDCRPTNLEEAYFVSDTLAADLGWPIRGWYCAATNPAVQRILGIDEPYYGRLFEPLVYESPAALDTDDFPPMMVEVEVAFELGSDLPPRGRAYTNAEVADAVSSVAGSIEVVAGHLQDWMSQDAYSVISDNGTDGALVVGPAHTRWREFDLVTMEASVLRNGVEERRGSGANVLESPLNALTWLANARAAVGNGLSAGQVHNTGTLTAPLPVERGDELTVRFDALGDVHLTLL